MSKIKTTIWSIDPHTEAKHVILKKYLEAWIPIIARYNSRVLYMDGFAGPGEYIGGKIGSPIIAINTILEHKANLASTEFVLVFIEKDKDRCNFLENKITKIDLPLNVKVNFICSEFDQYIEGLLKYVEEQQKILAPAFVFIDPFGFPVPMTLVSKIMENGNAEVLINFMYEEINRFISDEKLWPKLEEIFGTDEWKIIANNPQLNPGDRKALLHGIYKRQLEKKANIKYVQSFEMINKGNKTDYFLFFGTNSLVGLKKMKAAMWKVDKHGFYQFSDVTYNPKQPVMFETEPNYESLKKEILANFKGKTLSVQELENFVLTKTPFRETHFKKQILIPMEKAGPAELKAYCLNKKRRKGTFTADCILEFL